MYRLHLRLTRGSNPRNSDPMMKKLIMRSLESILDQCMELKLLPSTIIKQLMPLKNQIASAKKPQMSKEIASANVRCKRFSKVLAYAQLILC